ncbi:MAG: hypothetical protein U0W40_11700 [Acidimicrobiia bacterium]
MGNTALIEDPARPTTDPDAFAAVLAAANAGESWAWHHLHREYARRVRAYLRAQGAPEPDDLTSEVFLKVFARLATFSGNEPQFRRGSSPSLTTNSSTTCGSGVAVP